MLGWVLVNHGVCKSIVSTLHVWPHHTRIQGQQCLNQARLILRWCYRCFLSSQCSDLHVSCLQLRLKLRNLITSQKESLPAPKVPNSASQGPEPLLCTVQTLAFASLWIAGPKLGSVGVWELLRICLGYLRSFFPVFCIPFPRFSGIAWVLCDEESSEKREESSWMVMLEGGYT